VSENLKKSDAFFPKVISTAVQFPTQQLAGIRE